MTTRTLTGTDQTRRLILSARKLADAGMFVVTFDDTTTVHAGRADPETTVTIDREDRFRLSQRLGDRDNLAAYLAAVADLAWHDPDEIRALVPPAPDDVTALLPDYVLAWIYKLEHQPKRDHAAAYCAWQLGLIEHRPTNTAGWADKAERRADRLFAEPFERAAKGQPIT